ncbi:aspartate aminotransferase, cytoplasmic [Geosmithia morbida]|uniref:Aspartate aminotransferase n=1 Tax=Geosmithia morbida TaxID=1094350 RepID=A0A9P4YYG7_9HYPO|nr:aspartate aminotransferase, cytoplasmic [Geosmithia morbida]KAF4124104.1 aspartate aminotransferase, cytoplasmic [Geosmithia morbida]
MKAASFFDRAEPVPADAIFEVTKRYVADDFQDKVNLGQGTYRDGEGKPWILPAVRLAEQKLADKGHEYLPIEGLEVFRKEAVKVVFEGTTLLREGRIASCQALSGTGALLLTGLALRQAGAGIENVYITDPTWSNHDLLFSRQGFKVHKLPYYSQGKLDFDTFIRALGSAQPGSAVVLHACAHNPTGCDPTRAQWREMASVVRRLSLFPVFDSAYLGFSSGSLEEDRWAIRYFTEDLGLEAAVCLSFAKSMGLYGERVGLTAFTARTARLARTMSSILANCQRATVSNPPAYGAKIAAAVLADPDIKDQWRQDLLTMSGRIKAMRQKVYDELLRLGTPGDWSHLVNQIGMFGYTGISPAQVEYLEKKHHVYMAETSRISIAGLNEGNVSYFAKALDDAVRVTVA